MIGVIQDIPAPYRDKTFVLFNEKSDDFIIVATFPDEMNIHPEWDYNSLKEDYLGNSPRSIYYLGEQWHTIQIFVDG